MGIREAVYRLLDLLDAHIPSFRSAPEMAPRQFAAAGLMRSCALLKGVLVLEDANLPHLAGILARQHWETWLISLHVILRGDEALQEIAGDDIYWKRRLSDRLKLGLTYHEHWEGKVVKLNFKSLAERLKPLLIRAGESGDPDGVTGYDITYGVQSLFAVHAGLATIGAHLVYGPQEWSVEPNPSPPFPNVAQTPALHTAHLANYVLKAFALTTDALQPIWTELLGQQPANAGSVG